MDISRNSRYLLATLLTLGLSAPLALARDKGTVNRKAPRPSTGMAQGREERAEKKGVEGREERSLGKGREERTEKKGVEGREERAAHRHKSVKRAHRTTTRRTTTKTGLPRSSTGSTATLTV